MAESNEDQQFNSAPQGDRHGSEDATSGHVSVLLKEATDFLDIRRGGTYIDATVGLGGHSEAIARRLGPQGRLIGFDKDLQALAIARRRLAAIPQELAPEITLIHASFAELGRRIPMNSADGLLADIGLSSLQLADPTRGFSFQAEGWWLSASTLWKTAW